MRSTRVLFPVAAAFVIASSALASCGDGGGGRGTSPAAPGLPGTTVAAARKATVTMVLTLPARSSSSVRRLPQYISSATLGASVTVTVASTPLTSAFSVSPGASNCVTSSGTTTCTLAAPSPGFGAATIAVQLYDAAPVANAIPNSAALLSSGTVGATIAEGSANVTLPVVLAGVVEGTQAASATTLSSGGTAGSASFVIEAMDADTNVILASGGAVTRTGGAVSLTLTVPNSIAGVTLLDLTSNAAGTPAASITGVNPGDRIQISSSASTPTVIGVPVVVALGTTPIGLARVPSNGSGSPVAVPTSYPGTVNEIAAVPPWSNIDASSYGSGFVILSTSGNQIETGFIVNLATHVPTVGFQCSVPATFTVDHIAVGSYPNLALAEHTATDLTLNTASVGGGSCAAGTQAFSSLGQYGIGYPGTSWNDAADDGVSIGGAYVINAGGNGQNAIVTATENSTVLGGGNAIGTGSNQAAIDSLQMWYTKASVLAVGFTQLAYRNATNFVQTTALAHTPPAASVADGAGNLYVLYHDVAGTVEKCTLGATVTCTYVGALGAYNPSYNHRSMTLGPDNILYVATSAGFVHFNPANNTSVSNGSTAYSQAVASGDGHIYFLRANGSGVDAYP